MPNDLKSMKLTKADAKKETGVEVSKDLPRYPWGLRVELNDDALDRLGMPALPAIDEKMLLYARVEVTYVSQTASQEGKKRRSVSLQITDLSLSPDKPKKSIAERLFKSQGDE